MLEVKKFPSDMSTLEVDRKEARKNLVSGLFEENVRVGEENRSFYTYIKDGLLYNSPCLIIVPPDDIDTLEYIEKGNWIAFAEKHDVFLHFLKPAKDGWDLNGRDSAYMNHTYVQVNGRRSYVAMQDNIYALGFGRGASVAQEAVMAMMSEWSGLATFGDIDEEIFSAHELETGGRNTGKTELVISAAKVPVPVWMVFLGLEGTNGKAIKFWMKNNDSDCESYSNKWADYIYFPSPVKKKSEINEQKISEVRVTLKDIVDYPLLDEVWTFLSKACRHRGFGTKMLRNRIAPEKYGIVKRTMEYEGFTRIWYEYVPERVKKLKTPVPLVMNMHGRGGSAESFISLSEMNRVAEERDFIVVFPEASVSQQRPGALRNLLLWNGNYMGKHTDDVHFLLSIIEDVKKRYRIDSSRIYATGQSSGGMMSATLALSAPDVFAAVAPWSALVSPGGGYTLPDKLEPQVPFFFLFGENDWLCADSENGELEYHAAKDIAAFLRNLMRIYSLDEKPLRYTCGEISYYVYMNRKKVPMLTVGTVRNMSHANYPGESWISYDQFLSKFSKVDGKLLYMGESID